MDRVSAISTIRVFGEVVTPGSGSWDVAEFESAPVH
jgi:hypothetical protein